MRMKETAFTTLSQSFPAKPPTNQVTVELCKLVRLQPDLNVDQVADVFSNTQPELTRTQ